MSLLTLPNELIEQIIAELDSQRYFNNIIRTCQFFYESFIGLLYENEIRRDGAHAVLLYAAQMGHACTIQRLLQISASRTKSPTFRLSPNPSRPSHCNRWSPLLWSAIRGDEDVTRLLLGIDDIDVDIKCPRSRTPLSVAAEQGFVDVVRLLLTAGANPNTGDNLVMRTPLHWAGSPQLGGESRDLAHQNMFREEVQDPKCNIHCPLVVYFEVDIVGSSLWMEKEREKGDGVHFPEDAHGPPLMQPNLTSSLWSAGTNYKEILHLLLQYDAQLELTDSEGRTPLSWAATCGYQPLVELLFDSSVSLHSPKPALKKLSRLEEKRLKCADKERDCKKVIKNSVNRHAFPETDNDDSQSALSYAAENGHYGIVQFLLERTTRRDPLWSDPGWAPLVWAIRGGQAEMVKLLLSVHAQRWPEQSLGSQAAVVAARDGKTDIIPLLVEAGVKFEATQSLDYMTPLHLAAMNMHADTVKYLLDITEVDVNAPDGHGWTALDWATKGQTRAKIYWEDTRIKDMLLDRGASPSSRTGAELASPPHYFLRQFSGCTLGADFSDFPISFRCDWDSIAQGKKMRDLPYEKGCTIGMHAGMVSDEMIKQFQGWSYNRPRPIHD
ncbi:ankyrin [Penicillium waksmanii]|uniref:ankyrin n=1 Tax=Penicillium waksmanii TaxID=69791 RepID=UPI00254681F3|nr:ankyrin [Penicillium waksmanii]KAJ5984201.1 ankyrin [Penicillium waksmanii]